MKPKPLQDFFYIEAAEGEAACRAEALEAKAGTLKNETLRKVLLQIEMQEILTKRL